MASNAAGGDWELLGWGRPLTFRVHGCSELWVPVLTAPS